MESSRRELSIIEIHDHDGHSLCGLVALISSSTCGVSYVDCQCIWNRVRATDTLLISFKREQYYVQSSQRFVRVQLATVLEGIAHC